MPASSSHAPRIGDHGRHQHVHIRGIFTLYTVIILVSIGLYRSTTSMPKMVAMKQEPATVFHQSGLAESEEIDAGKTMLVKIVSNTNQSPPIQSNTNYTTISIPIRDIMHDLVIVSGFWKIPNNRKNSVAEFTTDVGKTLKFFARWADNRNTSIVYHTNCVDHSQKTHVDDQESGNNDDIMFRSIFEQYRAHPALHFQHTSLHQLLYEEAKHIVTEQCSRQNLASYGYMDKALQHSRLYAKTINMSLTEGSDDKSAAAADALEGWIQVISVWISKLHLLNQTVHDPKHNDKTYIAWMDGALSPKLLHGIYHRTIQMRAPPSHNITTDQNGVHITAGSYKALLPTNHVWFRPSITSWNHTKIQFRAGVMLGTRPAWKRIIEAYTQTLSAVIESRMPMCFDEEILLTYMWTHHKSGAVDSIRSFMRIWKDWKRN